MAAIDETRINLQPQYDGLIPSPADLAFIQQIASIIVSLKMQIEAVSMFDANPVQWLLSTDNNPLGETKIFPMNQEMMQTVPQRRRAGILNKGNRMNHAGLRFSATFLVSVEDLETGLTTGKIVGLLQSAVQAQEGKCLLIIVDEWEQPHKKRPPQPPLNLDEIYA